MKLERVDLPHPELELALLASSDGANPEDK
jgi:hypothetical protein